MSTFKRVANWNILCGKQPPTFGTTEYFDALMNQRDRIVEELDEFNEAVTKAAAISRELAKENPDETVKVIVGSFTDTVPVTIDELNKWHQEILDAGCDLDVVVAGANFLSGHAYEQAINAVLENNDAKYTGDIKFAQASLAEYGEGHSIKSTHVQMDSSQQDSLEEAGFSVYINNGHMYAIIHTVHRDSDDKICKLKDHPKVDLIPFTRTSA